MDDCIFCKIVKGEIPSQKIYEDEKVLAFYDISPAAPVHILIIPKKHIDSVIALKEDDQPELWAVFAAVAKVAKLAGVEQDGFRLVTNVGKNGGQSVKHLHFHMLGGKKYGENFG